MPGEIVEDGLPTLALHLRIVFSLRLERLRHYDATGLFAELHFDVTAVGHPEFDDLLGHDSGVRPLEVETGAAVFRLHPRGELASLPQIDGALSGVPVVRGGVP